MDIKKLEKNMVNGSAARLFPVLSDSKKEEKATSILLSIFAVAPDFARAVLEEAGASVGKRAKIECFTEVSFKGSHEKSRPDGLILVTNGKKQWAALVESKVGRASLTNEQVETYLDIAKEQGFDAVITISNQFAQLPTHHPLTVSKLKTRRVNLYHFSWMSLTSKALLLLESKSVEDVEQTFLLKELIHYLKSDSSGVMSQFKLSGEWREICTSVHQKIRLTKSSDTVVGAIANWFQTLRYLSIQLSIAVGKPCSVKLSKKYRDDDGLRLSETISKFIDNPVLSGDFEVPNAASFVSIELDLSRKSLQCGIEIRCPDDVKQPKSAINFVVNQLKNYECDDLQITVNYPRRIADLTTNLQTALDEDGRRTLLHSHTKELPVSVVVWRDTDLGTQSLKSPSLPQLLDRELQRFYDDVVEELKAWQPKAPRIRRSRSPDSSPQSDDEAVSVDPHSKGSIKSETFLETLKG